MVTASGRKKISMTKMNALPRFLHTFSFLSAAWFFNFKDLINAEHFLNIALDDLHFVLEEAAVYFCYINGIKCPDLQGGNVDSLVL